MKIAVPAVSGERPQVQLHGSKPLAANGKGSPTPSAVSDVSQLF